MTWLIAALVVGALASAGSGILSRYNDRQEAIKEADYQQDQNDADKVIAQAKKASALGTMERELTVAKEDDFSQAAAIQRGASNQFTSSMQETYLSQLAGESKHMDLMAGSVQEMGNLNATMGSSGARKDTTLSNIMAADHQRQIAESRKTLDSTRDLSVGTGQMNLAEANTKAGEIRAKYNEGSAFMDLYNFKRADIENLSDLEMAKYDLKDSYLDDIIEDNEYDFGWFMADFFGVAGAAANGVASAYGLGAIK